MSWTHARPGLRGVLLAAGLMLTTLTAAPAQAAGGKAEPLLDPEWSFEGIFGRYDRAALQRGFQVYRNVCSACHSLELIAFRNLYEPGGPEFPEAVVKEIAASYQIPTLDEFGNSHDSNGLPVTRPGRPEDRIPPPFPNETAARAANNGAYPPDLSVINKARHYGADYVYSLLQGYEQPPEDFNLQPGLYYNIYYPGQQFAMAQPLYPDMVAYDDGTDATIQQMSADVTHFLEWAGEPKMEQRKSLGVNVMIYLGIFALLLYISYRRVWRDVEH